MASLDLITVARDDTYAGRVAMVQLTVAQNVASEDPATAHHAERINYAYYVIRGAENAKMVSAHVNSQPGIAVLINADPSAMGANVQDNDIEFTLASIWDARSLAFAAA